MEALVPPPAAVEGEEAPEEPAAHRFRRRFKSAETQAGASTDWSTFDMGASIQLLRSDDQGVVRRTMRLLHIRLYHTSAIKMRDILRNAGTPPNILRIVQEIVDTCATCRAFAGPGNKSATASRTPEHFNDIVQVDLIFVESAVKTGPQQDTVDA